MNCRLPISIAICPVPKGIIPRRNAGQNITTIRSLTGESEHRADTVKVSVCGSDVRALVKQPFAVFSRRKLLIAVVTCRDYARRSLATLQNRPALGGDFATCNLTKSRDSDGEPQQCSPYIRDDTYRLPAR